METVKLSANARVDLGKKATKALRNDGQVPAVLYGGESTIHFSVKTLALRNLVYTPNVYTTEIEVEGKTYNAILKDIQFHPVTDAILHVDFMALIEGKEISLSVPVNITGNAKGVMQGGKIRKNMRRLSVRATPENLPNSIALDVTELTIGKSIRVSDVEATNYDILNPASAVIVAVKMARGAVVEDEEAEAAAETAEA